MRAKIGAFSFAYCHHRMGTAAARKFWDAAMCKISSSAGTSASSDLKSLTSLKRNLLITPRQNNRIDFLLIIGMSLFIVCFREWGIFYFLRWRNSAASDRYEGRLRWCDVTRGNTCKTNTSQNDGYSSDSDLEVSRNKMKFLKSLICSIFHFVPQCNSLCEIFLVQLPIINFYD